MMILQVDPSRALGQKLVLVASPEGIADLALFGSYRPSVIADDGDLLSAEPALRSADATWSSGGRADYSSS